MVLRLDPRYPLVWRSPTSLQIGVASPIAVLDDVTPSDERLLAALSVGITAEGLTMLARATGAGDEAAFALLRLVESALLAEQQEPWPTVAVVGSGATAAAVVRAIEGAGISVTGDQAEPCDLAVIVAHYVVEPELHGLWLRRDVPHLPVVLADTAATIGPVVEPGSGPCLYCLQRYRTEADAAWPAIASQLWGRARAEETPLVSIEVAAVAARLAVNRVRAGVAASAHRSLRYTTATGEVVATEVRPHPACGCVELSAASRPGSDWPAAARRGRSHPRSSRSPPMTGSASCVPA